MKRITPERIYVVIEIFLFTALLAFQIVAIVNGFLTYDKQNPSFVFNQWLQVSLTFGSLVYACWYAITHRQDRLRLLDWIPVYFVFILIADIFFSLTDFGFMGHVFFTCAYLFFALLRRARLFEYAIYALTGTAGVLLLFFLGKLTLNLGIDCFLGSVLIGNAVASWIRWGKTKKKAHFFLALAMTTILLSDLGIGARTFITANYPLNHAISLLVWPTYIVGNILLNFFLPRLEDKDDAPADRLASSSEQSTEI